jgi:hypothetical protein
MARYRGLNTRFEGTVKVISKESPQFANPIDDQQKLDRPYQTCSFSEAMDKRVIRKAAPATRFSRDASMSTVPSPYWVHWIQSGSNLDFCVLALCSCVLSVLCHQTTVLSPLSTTARTAAPPVQPIQVDFAIKAGLFTTSPKIEEESESE